MKIIAIISEYNPFHLGHLNQINQIKKIFKNEEIYIISIMSGNFIQRGEPSIINKFKKCEMALNNGINLCLELPVHISLSSAEGFAYGAVKILNELKIVDYLCFGCEILNENKLNTLSDALLSLNKTNLKKYLDQGISYPKAIETFILENFKDEELTKFIQLPNNILAIEYVKALKLLKSNIKILPIKRIGGNYNEKHLNQEFSSATSIRNFLLNNEDISILKSHVPEKNYELLKTEFLNKNLVSKNQTFEYIKYKLLTSKNIHKIEGVNEGLENKFYKEIYNSNSIDQLILNVKSKRYTYTKISRILMKYFIGFENINMDSNINNNYVRILGFDKKGNFLLNKIKKITDLNLISNFNKKNYILAPLDILSTKAYSFLNKTISPNEDFKKHPIIKL